jgi:hypothetical protein
MESIDFKDEPIVSFVPEPSDGIPSDRESRDDKYVRYEDVRDDMRTYFSAFVNEPRLVGMCDVDDDRDDETVRTLREEKTRCAREINRLDSSFALDDIIVDDTNPYEYVRMNATEFRALMSGDVSDTRIDGVSSSVDGLDTEESDSHGVSIEHGGYGPDHGEETSRVGESSDMFAIMRSKMISEGEMFERLRSSMYGDTRPFVRLNVQTCQSMYADMLKAILKERGHIETDMDVYDTYIESNSKIISDDIDRHVYEGIRILLGWTNLPVNCFDLNSISQTITETRDNSERVKRLADVNKDVIRVMTDRVNSNFRRDPVYVHYVDHVKRLVSSARSIGYSDSDIVFGKSDVNSVYFNVSRVDRYNTKLTGYLKEDGAVQRVTIDDGVLKITLGNDISVRTFTAFSVMYAVTRQLHEYKTKIRSPETIETVRKVFTDVDADRVDARALNLDKNLLGSMSKLNFKDGISILMILYASDMMNMDEFSLYMGEFARKNENVSDGTR